MADRSESFDQRSHRTTEYVKTAKQPSAITRKVPYLTESPHMEFLKFEVNKFLSSVAIFCIVSLFVLVISHSLSSASAAA